MITGGSICNVTFNVVNKSIPKSVLVDRGGFGTTRGISSGFLLWEPLAPVVLLFRTTTGLGSAPPVHAPTQLGHAREHEAESAGSLKAARRGDRSPRIPRSPRSSRRRG